MQKERIFSQESVISRRKEGIIHHLLRVLPLYNPMN